MAYLGHKPAVGENNSFRILDDISSFVLTFDGSSASVVGLSDETITITENNHRFITGQRVTYSNGGGGNITGLTNGQAYFVINHSKTQIKLASSASNALAGTAINLTALGTGSSHTLTLAFDGINTKFVPTFGDGMHDTLIKRAAQLVISINGVIQQPHDTATPSTGFGVDSLGNIIFSTPPASTDIFWAHVLATNTVTFDSSDNDVDTFTGNGSTTSFTLSKTPPDNRNILVTIDGVVQYPSDAANTRSYTLSENVMTFVSAPGNGTSIQVRHIGYAGPAAGGGGGVTGFYGRTGNVSLVSTDNITVNDAAITGDATVTGNLTVDGDMTTLNTTLREVELLRVDANSALTAGIITQRGSGDILNLFDTNTEVLTVKDGGLVGIGTDIPHHLLDVKGNAIFGPIQNAGNPGQNTGIATVRGHFVNAVGDFARLYFSNSVSAGGVVPPNAYISGKRDGIQGSNWSAGLAFYTDHRNPSSNTPIERMVIGSTGYVGIASARPQQRLDVIGTIQKTRTNGEPQIKLQEDASANGQIVIHNNNNIIKTQLGSAGVSFFATTNVGIGSTIPTQKLDVIGTSKFQGDINITSGNQIKLSNNANSANATIDCDGGARLHLKSYSQSVATFEEGVGTIFYQSSGTARLTITPTGGVEVGAGGTIKIPDKIMHVGDEDTSIRFPDANQISMETADSEAFRINSGGHFNLGRDYSTNPQNGLVGITTIRGHRVNSEGDYARLYFKNSSVSGSSSASIRAYRDGGNYQTGFSFYTNYNPSSGGDGQERFIINSTGTIVKQSFASNQTYAANDTTQLGYQAQNKSDVTNTYAALRLTAGNTSPATAQLSSIRTGSGQNDFTIQLESGNTAFEALRIDSDGDVGIGDNNPNIRLTVVDTGTENLVRLGRSDGSSHGSHTVNVKASKDFYHQFQMEASGYQLRAYDGSNMHEVFKVLNTGFAEFAGANDVRLTLGSYGTAGSNGANWVRGVGSSLYYNAATSDHLWEIGGAEHMRLNNSGNLYLRSESANYVVLGNSGDSTSNNVTNGMNWIRGNQTHLQYNSNGGMHAWEISGSEKLRLTSDGDLRLGLNSAGNATDSAHYIMTLTGKSGQTGAGGIAFRDPSANTDGFIFADDGNLFITADYSSATADSSIRFRVDGSNEKVRINHSGDYGILKVADNNTSSVGNHGFRFGSWGIQMRDTGGYNHWYIRRNYGGWQTSPQVTFKGNGYTGINRLDPTHYLDVDGTSVFRDRIFFGTGSMKSVPFGANVTYDTGISINAYGYGGSILALCSRNYGAGTSTQAGLYFLEFKYDGNNMPTIHHVSGDNFVTFNKSASNTLTVLMGASNNIITMFESSVVNP